MKTPGIIKGDIKQVAAIVGCCPTTVRNAIRLKANKSELFELIRSVLKRVKQEREERIERGLQQWK